MKFGMRCASHKHGRLSPLAVRAVARASTTEKQRREETLRICETQGCFPVLEFLCDSVSLWWVLLGTGDRCRFRTAPARARNITAARPRLPYSESMHGRTWKAWLVPGGLLLALAAALVNSSLFAQVAPSLSFYYVAVFAAGLLLAWRFNSSRVLFSLLPLLLAHRAAAFFSSGQVRTGPGRTPVLLPALLTP